MWYEMIRFLASRRISSCGSSEDGDYHEVYELGFLEQFNTHVIWISERFVILLPGLSHVCSL